MFRVSPLLFYLSLFFNVACQSQGDYKSRAEEVFPSVPIKYVGLYRVDNLPIGPAFFNGQWSVVIFGKASCNNDCMQRLKLVNEADVTNKLFVIDDLADYKKLRELAEKFPDVEITMGTTASLFDKFYAHFDVDLVEPAQKHQTIYLVNPSSELVYILPQAKLTSSDIEKEIAVIRQK